MNYLVLLNQLKERDYRLQNNKESKDKKRKKEVRNKQSCLKVGNFLDSREDIQGKRPMEQID